MESLHAIDITLIVSTNKCNRCMKKLTLLDKQIKCRCGKCFCSNHRLPE